MRLKVNTTDIDPIRVGDRLEFRFHSGEDLQYIILDNGDILGDIELSEIQLEQSSISTPFVEPMQSETVASGLFKTVQGISYEITSPESDTWAEIRQTVEGSITTYHNGPLQSTIAHTIDDIIFGMRDIVSGDQASFNLRLDGIQQTVKDEMFQSVQTQLSNFVGLQLTDIEGNVNEIQNTVQGTIQHISDVEGNLNILQSTVDGTVQSITDIEGNYNTIQDTVNSHSQIIGTDGGNIAQLLMNDQLFQVNVIDEIANAKSSVTVLSDSIGLRSSGNEIFIGGSGIMIDAESIYLGSSTQIKDGIITNSLIASNANINGAKIANATIASGKIVNLDVDKLSGNIAEFVRVNFNGAQSALTLESTGLVAKSTHNGITLQLELTSRGFEFRSHNRMVGMMHAGRDGIYISPFHNENLHLTGGGTPFDPYFVTPVVTIAGDGSGTHIHNRMYVDNIYPVKNMNEGIDFVRGSIGGNQGFYIRHTNTNKAGIMLADNGDLHFRRSNGTWRNLSTWNF